MKLRGEIIEKVKANAGLRKEILAVADVSRQSLHTWLSANDENLTKAGILKVIADHYNCKMEDLLEEETKAA